MTPEAQRVAIAKACGWKYIRRQSLEPHDYRGTLPPLRSFTLLPDYLNDLNAMHEAENILDGQQQITYCQMLCVAQDAPEWAYTVMAFASSEHRAEALLRTLGLWEP